MLFLPFLSVSQPKMRLQCEGLARHQVLITLEQPRGHPRFCQVFPARVFLPQNGALAHQVNLFVDSEEVPGIEPEILPKSPRHKGTK